MAVTILPRRYVQQPQQVVQPDGYWLSRGMKFLNLPSAGSRNLVGSAAFIQSSGPFPVASSPVGITYEGNYRAECGTMIDASKGLTIITIIRARATQYLNADADRVLISTRTSGNAGWSWGRNDAVGGGSTGNLTRQSLIFQGVAQYIEANYSIESLVDTPVACRYNPSTASISWFRFGQKSSADTTSVGSPSFGNNLIFGAQGDYASNALPWIDRCSILVVFEGVLTDSEILTLTADVSSIWKVIRSYNHRWTNTIGGTQSYSYTASGGMVISGTGPIVKSAIKLPTGGLTFLGTANPARGASRTTTGGLTFSGTATPLRSLVRAATGGVLFSGAASVSFSSAVQSLTVIASGGILIRGTAAMVRGVVKVVTGGIIFGGSASITLTPDPNPTTARHRKRGRRPRQKI